MSAQPDVERRQIRVGSSRPYVPAAPLLALVRRLRPDHDPRALFDAWGIDPDVVAAIDRGKQRSFPFDVADLVVTMICGDAGLWQTEPFLAALYVDEPDEG